MRTLAVLPIKNFFEAKQRLEAVLSSGPRRALAEAMFSDVLTALRRASAVEDILVVTRDHGAQQIAGGHGALVLDDDEPGQSAAAVLGVRYALDHDYERVLLVPGDCPMLSPSDVDALVAHAQGSPSALIVPDRHGTGTNALVLTPPDSVTPAFGPDSRERHVANAEAAGTTFELTSVPSLELDIDTPDDLEVLRGLLETSHGGAAHTRGMLSQMLRSRA
ncbi:MAG: 2-phospho-L-lactate/phosphoenolpyruvate guanylyltransferase [Solirubrobacteraceae bacterium]|jgi:2-phospho-L-lactate guanylyltransferase|nr:2-phospho-L-lactate/phosphoenolpyruvate guanylyltransferase [Solirubrobacteraceae bacterium]